MPEGSPIPGRFSFRITPYLVDPLNCMIEPSVKRIVFRKSAQVGWTDGVILNAIGHRIDADPCRVLVLFPREKTAIDFNDEKLEPMIQAVPALSAKVKLGSRSAGNRQLFKKFHGGFLKLLVSNAPGDVKSTSAPVCIVEEPDDCNQNVKGQGDSIKLAEERVKTYYNSLIVLGGTPTIEKLSAMDAEFDKSDKRFYNVLCHECDVAAPLEFDNVRWVKDENLPDAVYGKHQVDTARYECPHCHSLWDDAQKNRNVRRSALPEHRGRAGWIATAPFRGTAGFHLNEVISPFPDSKMANLARKFLDATRKADAGDYDDLIAFYNSTLAKSWAFQSSAPKGDVLRERAEDYAEFSVPAGGLMLALGIDVQHDRLALMLWAFGRGEESWLIFWGEIHGNTVDPKDGVWEELDRYLLRVYRHATGAEMFIEACSIDSGDGQTSDAVYAWVRKHKRAGRRVMAAKGASDKAADREVFSVPSQKSVDASTPTKASKYGLRVYMVGTQKAKDLILGHQHGAGRLNLAGTGPGRMHWYRDVRADFYDQITSEVKAPLRSSRRLVWQKKAGAANEGLDGTILALHAARALNSNRMDDGQWSTREAKLRQVDLLPRTPEQPAVAPQKAPPAVGNPLQLNPAVAAPAPAEEARPW